jgi:type VI secretion system secreted protein VgrG
MHELSVALKIDGKELADIGIVGIRVVERVSEPFSIEIAMRAEYANRLTPEAIARMVHKDAALTIELGTSKRHFHGLVLGATVHGGGWGAASIWKLRIAPKFSLLAHSRKTRTFLDQKVTDIVKSVLGEWGLNCSMNATTSITHTHITQYEESDLAFISRLLEQEGLSYWFDVTTSSHKLAIGGSTGSFPDAGTLLELDVNIGSLHLDVSAVPSSVEVYAYDEERGKEVSLGTKAVAPAGPLKSMAHTNGKLTFADDVDAGATQPQNHADALAKAASSRFASAAARLRGASDTVTLSAGRRVDIKGMPGFDGKCLIIEVIHQLGILDPENESADPQDKDRVPEAYRNTFVAVPPDALPWVPERRTPVPRISGLVPGKVTATAGQQTNGYLDGSYKVKLLAAKDDAGERIARMAQPYAGPAQGIHFPLPVNTEVLIGHMHGNPDRPVIAGALPNQSDPSPVAEANKTQCIIRTASGHHILFEDKSGEEQVQLKGKTGNQLTLTEKSGSEMFSLVATKDHEVKAEGKSDTTVTGKITITGKDEIAVEATNKLVLKCGSASITMESSGKITIDGSEIAITGSATVKLEAKAAFEAKGGTMKLESQGPLDAKGAMMTLESQGPFNAKGALVNLEASGPLSAKGAIVKLN